MIGGDFRLLAVLSGEWVPTFAVSRIDDNSSTYRIMGEIRGV